MRIHFKLEGINKLIPFNYHHHLTTVIHKWIGTENEYHGEISLYSFSQLASGRIAQDSKGLQFSNGASFFFSCHNTDLFAKIIDGAQRDPSLFYGFKLREMVVQPQPVFENVQRFYTASPILIKRNIDGRQVHFTYQQTESDVLMTETLQHKLRLAKLSDQGVRVQFDRDYSKARTKLVNYDGIKNKCNACPVIVSGTPTQIAFAWNVGIGNSTGIGLGAVTI